MEYSSVEEFHTIVEDYIDFETAWNENIPKKIQKPGFAGYRLCLSDYIFEPEKVSGYLANNIEETTQERLEEQSKKEQEKRRKNFLSTMKIVLPAVGVAAIAAIVTVLLLRRRKKTKAAVLCSSAALEPLEPPGSDSENSPADHE